MAVSKLRFPTQHQGHMMSLTTSTIIFLLAMDADGRLAWFRRMWLSDARNKIRAVRDYNNNNIHIHIQCHMYTCCMYISTGPPVGF